MEAREMEALVQRLVQNPHDQDAVFTAHQAGQADPRSYAMLLEKVGTATGDPAFASHWLTEAANVWSAALGDAHRAARALMIAIDRDPTQATAAERLAELYREKGDVKALVALLERRAKALGPLLARDPGLRSQLSTIHEELGRLWSEAPLSQPKKAVENYRRALEYDPNSQFSVYSLRELFKAQGQWSEALPLFEAEQRMISDPERAVALYQDEAEVRRSVGDLPGATQALRAARAQEGGTDATLKQQIASLVLERVQAGEPVGDEEKNEAGALFVELSEEYPGEHGLSYSLCALELVPSLDRAMQLAIYYGEQLGRVGEAAPKAAGYLRSNPQGPLAADARRVVTQAMELGGDEALLDALRPPPGADVSEQIDSLVEVAQALARKGKKNEAAVRYREVLTLDPDNLDAIGFLEPHLRQTRKLVELRDILLAASGSEAVELEQRKDWLKEVATLCESQLRDSATAILALKEIVRLDPEDEAARSQLKRSLEKTAQWDVLAEVLAQEAEQTEDVEARISLEKSLAKLHDQRRKDPIATGETWARIAQLTPDDEEAILTAVKHFEHGERPELAARVISDNLQSISSDATRASLLEKLGELRLSTGETMAAGEAFAEGASLARSPALWQSAERAFVAAEAFAQAATAADERAQLTSSRSEQAALYAVCADYLVRAGDEPNAVLRLEQATDLDPESNEFAAKLEEFYDKQGRQNDLASLLIKRASQLSDRAARVALRRRAADLQNQVLGDIDGARDTMKSILEDGDDQLALAWLAGDAEANEDNEEAVEYLSRLVKVASEPGERLDYALREAALVADGLGDTEGAIERYQRILRDLDPKHVGALQAIADLNEKDENLSATAAALEQVLELQPDGEEKIATAERLAKLYEGELDDPTSAVRVLEIVRRLEPENFDAAQRLSELSERLENWPRVAELLAVLIEVEGDEEEVSRMTRRLAEILHEKVGKGDDALAALMQVADTGDEPCREDYVRLGDELGWKGIVASKLVEWYAQSPAGPTRNEALRGAFDRFVEVGRESDAAEVAKELARSRGADNDLATRLEAIAIKLKDLEALSVAHDLLAQALTGPPRAEELVRQAEVLRDVGVEVAEAVQHGEQGLPSVPPADAGPLLERLAKVAGTPEGIIDLYERQVTRCRAPSDRLPALARAAQVAASHGALDRARQFFDLAVSGNVQEDTLSVLEEAARTSDNELGGDRLKRTLAEALAAGGQGSRDGGRTRSAMLGRAAQLAYVDLKDVDQAFTWLGDAIVAHVDDERLDALESLALEVEQPTRAEAVLSRALEEVFDGPLVRRLLARRAALRRGKLSDMPGAASDLKRLHDLSPSDTQVMDELLELYTELKDYRGIVSLYEDQILRGKDPASRAELARKVARVWEDELVDAREAADAWRRVLRMKAGDPEASEGLERAKNAMLKRPPEEPSRPAASKSAPSAASPPVSESGLDADEETAGESTTSTASEFSAATSEAPESETSAEEETIPGTTARMQEALASQVPQAEPSADDDDRSWNTDPAPAPLEEPSELPADDGNSEETVPGSALPKSTASSKRGGAKSPSPPSDSRPLGSAPNSSKTPSRQAPPPPGRAGRAVPASRSAAAVAPYGAAQGDVTEVRSPSGLLDPEDNEEPAADVDDEELIDGRS
jgi:hypothetical protein